MKQTNWGSLHVHSVQFYGGVSGTHHIGRTQPMRWTLDIKWHDKRIRQRDIFELLVVLARQVIDDCRGSAGVVHPDGFKLWVGMLAVERCLPMFPGALWHVPRRVWEARCAEAKRRLFIQIAGKYEKIEDISRKVQENGNIQRTCRRLQTWTESGNCPGTVREMVFAECLAERPKDRSPWCFGRTCSERTNHPSPCNPPPLSYQGLLGHHVVTSFVERMPREGTRRIMTMHAEYVLIRFIHWIFFHFFIFFKLYSAWLYVQYMKNTCFKATVLQVDTSHASDRVASANKMYFLRLSFF